MPSWRGTTRVVQKGLGRDQRAAQFCKRIFENREKAKLILDGIIMRKVARGRNFPHCLLNQTVRKRLGNHGYKTPVFLQDFLVKMVEKPNPDAHPAARLG